MAETKSKLIPVRLVSQTGKNALVEWVAKGAVKRGYLPADKVTSDKLDQELLEAAAPYGIPWAEMPFKAFTGADLEKALHNADIWTEEQVRTNAQKVIGALQTLYLVHLGSLVEFAAKYKQ
jgi:hypothetical protein